MNRKPEVALMEESLCRDNTGAWKTRVQQPV